jgi:hypothetical protein
MVFLCAREEPSLMVPNLPPAEGGSQSREQILEFAAHEMQRWERERKQNTQLQARTASKTLILCAVALLIFLCGYVAGQYSSGISPTGSSQAKVHETIKP